MANIEQYRAVLQDLMKQRNELQFRIGEIEAAMAALRRLMPIETAPMAMEKPTPLPTLAEGKFAGMSTRWAILALLSEDATGPMNTGQIAEALRAHGMASNAKSFAGNVSAVLSGMNHEKGEVQSSIEGWTITDKGKQAWIHIKASRERKMHESSQASLPTEPPQPSVQ